MLKHILSAEVGRRIAGRNSGVKGALLGAAAPWLVRRAFTPVGLALMGAYAAKKLYDKKKEHDRRDVRVDRVTAPRSEEPR